MYEMSDPPRRKRGRTTSLLSRGRQAEGTRDTLYGIGPDGPFRSRLEAGLHQFTIRREREKPAATKPPQATNIQTPNIHTPGTHTALAPKTSATPPRISGPEDADAAITEMMKDARYWQPNHPQRDAYRTGIARLWKAAYPGAYRPGSFGKGDTPAISAGQALTLADKLLPKQAAKKEAPVPPKPFDALGIQLAQAAEGTLDERFGLTHEDFEPLYPNNWQDQDDDGMLSPGGAAGAILGIGAAAVLPDILEARKHVNGKDGKKATDHGKNEAHGDGGRAQQKANKRLEEFHRKLEAAKSRKERNRIQKTQENIGKHAARKKRGENHSRGSKR